MKKIISSMLVFLMAVSFMVMPISASDQPAMKNARDHLNKAKDALNRATPDKGGHRNRAREFVNKAIAQVNAGINYDATHLGNRRKRNFTVDESLLSISSVNWDQPAMKEAKEQLEKALDSLNNATPDKGGHRNNAISHTKNAIEQVNKGMAYDANN